MPGWDGSTHLAIGKIYASSIFPGTWGWINQWYIGMPFPQFYPPLFYFLVALASKIFFFIKYELIFRFFVLFSLLATPCLISFLAYKLSGKKLVTVISGIIAVILLSYCGPDLNIGVGVGGTINTGLLANSLAFNFFVIWLIYFLKKSWKRTDYFFGVCFLASVFLTNVHLIVPALAFFIVKHVVEIFPLLIKKSWSNVFSVTFLRYIPYGLIALGLSAYWVLPMFSRYDYFSTTTLNIDQGVVLYYFIIFSYLPFFFAVSFIVRRSLGIRYLSGCIAFLALVVTLDTLMPVYAPLPLHVIRWISPIIYLSAIPVADVFVYLYEQCKYRWHNIVWFAFMVLFLIGASYYSLFSYRNTDGIYDGALKDGVFDVASYLKGEAEKKPNSLTLVEANTSDGQPKSFALDSILGQNNIPTVFSNLRESSMSGLYLTPIRNMFSQYPESWGIQSFLAFNDSFTKDTPVKTKLSIASYFGISSIVTSSASSTYILENQLKLKKTFSTGIFSVFDIPETPIASVVNQPPVAIFSDITLKDRDWNTFSFSRISEEWLSHFDSNDLFVRPNENIIENNPVFDFSKVVVLDSYAYKNHSNALLTLENFVKNNGKVYIILNTENDRQFTLDLLDSLSQSYKSNVKGVAHNKGYVGDIFQDVASDISGMSTTITSSTPVNFSIDGNRMHITLDSTIYNDTYLSNHKVPILIKRSYFPDWKSLSGDVYLVSPSFILYFPKVSDSYIEFTKPLILYVSYGISLLSLAFLIYYSYFWRRNE